MEFQAQVAAWLFDKMHFKQEQIAEHLGIRQPDVSRRLKLAEERGWLSRPVFLRSRDISDDRLDEIENAFYRKLPELRDGIERLSRERRPVDPPPKVQVFYSGPTATDKAGYQKRQQMFGWNAALYVRELVPRMHTRSASPGARQSARLLIDGLAPLQPRFSRGTLFFPVSGEPLREHGEENSATTLAAGLQAFVGGSPNEVPGLNMVIPCIPDLFNDDVTSQIKQSLLGQVEGYRRIFLASPSRTNHGAAIPGQERLIDQMETLITGVGTASKTSTDPWLIERVNAMHNVPPLTREDFEAYTFGDIAGVYLLRPRLSEIIAARNAKSSGASGKAAREENERDRRGESPADQFAMDRNSARARGGLCRAGADTLAKHPESSCWRSAGPNPRRSSKRSTSRWSITCLSIRTWPMRWWTTCAPSRQKKSERRGPAELCDPRDTTNNTGCPRGWQSGPTDKTITDNRRSFCHFVHSPRRT